MIDGCAECSCWGSNDRQLMVFRALIPCSEYRPLVVNHSHVNDKVWNNLFRWSCTIYRLSRLNITHTRWCCWQRSYAKAIWLSVPPRCVYCNCTGRHNGKLFSTFDSLTSCHVCCSLFYQCCVAMQCSTLTQYVRYAFASYLRIDEIKPQANVTAPSLLVGGRSSSTKGTQWSIRQNVAEIQSHACWSPLWGLS
jgi:hypothetical protein